MKTYFGEHKSPEIYIESLYKKENWNCYSRILKNLPRTTNNVEAWHRVFNQSCFVVNPNIAVVISVMKDEEELNKMEIFKLIMVV